jgi:hypothetical protein
VGLGSLAISSEPPTTVGLSAAAPHKIIAARECSLVTQSLSHILDIGGKAGDNDGNIKNEARVESSSLFLSV